MHLAGSNAKKRPDRALKRRVLRKKPFALLRKLPSSRQGKDDFLVGTSGRGRSRLFSEVLAVLLTGVRGGQLQADWKRRLSIFSALIRDSRVERGMPSLSAAPDGPEMRPLLAASADSIISFSWLTRVSGKGGTA